MLPTDPTLQTPFVRSSLISSGNTTSPPHRHSHTPNKSTTHYTTPLTQIQPNLSPILLSMSTTNINYISSQSSLISDTTNISTTIPHSDTHDSPTTNKLLHRIILKNDQTHNDTLCLPRLLLHQDDRRVRDSRLPNILLNNTTTPQTHFTSTTQLATYNEMLCGPILFPSQRDRISLIDIPPNTTQQHYSLPKNYNITWATTWVN